MGEDVPAPASIWDGEVDGEEPVQAVSRGKTLKHFDENYLVGTLWAKDRRGRRAARLTFEVYPSRRMVLLGNIDANGSVGEAGDVRRRGAARALMDELDRRFPPPDWWIAAEVAAIHTEGGVALMRSRRKPGRQWVHVSDCADRLPSGCSCEFSDPDPSQDA